MPLIRMNGAAAPVALDVLEGVAEDPVEVPFSCSAKSWNAVKLRADDSSEFTANTMPAPQWLDGDF